MSLNLYAKTSNIDTAFEPPIQTRNMFQKMGNTDYRD